MPTITYKDITDFIGQTPPDNWPAVSLVFGEEMLCKKVTDTILDVLIPEAKRALGVEVFDGGEDTMGTVLSSLNTYALLAASKVVVLNDARLFYSTKARQGLREKMEAAAQSGEMQKASRPFLNLLSLSKMQFEDLDNTAMRTQIADDLEGQPAPWFSRLMEYCREKGLKIPTQRDDGDLLTSALDKGFPRGHRLVITTDIVDRRKILFKSIADTGLVVDCSVPKGETRADRSAQQAVMQAIVDELLARTGKRMAAGARRQLMEWTGFDLRTLSGNLEKLISFVGGRQTITETDVTTALQRTRKDPIFEFTNALAQRDLSAALFFMNSLLENGMHPLQLLAAAANQIRRLLLAKDFIDRDRGRTWSPRMHFNQFKSSAFKAVQKEDGAFADLLDRWNTIRQPTAKGKKGKKAAFSDLLLAKNPKSPYPVFQTLKNADAFSLDALTAAIATLSGTDRRMKSTGQDPRLLLEAFLIDFCR